MNAGKLILKNINFFVLSTVFYSLFINSVFAFNPVELKNEANKSLARLFKHTSNASMLAKKAKGVLVFPSIWKVGFIVGGQAGDGILFSNGKTDSYYKMSSLSFGIQLGAQNYSYALFFMTDQALAHLKNDKGLELGVGPSVVVVDQEMSVSLMNKSLDKDIYVFFFEPTGLMAGLGVQGTKINIFEPEPFYSEHIIR